MFYNIAHSTLLVDTLKSTESKIEVNSQWAQKDSPCVLALVSLCNMISPQNRIKDLEKNEPTLFFRGAFTFPSSHLTMLCQIEPKLALGLFSSLHWTVISTFVFTVFGSDLWHPFLSCLANFRQEFKAMEHKTSIFSMKTLTHCHFTSPRLYFSVIHFAMYKRATFLSLFACVKDLLRTLVEKNPLRLA